jgi:outer membrane protein OmpA-like peptidoglycan-associated protein
MKLKVVAHADDRDATEPALDLAARRAKNVVAELMGARGIAPERLVAEGAATVPSTDRNNAESGSNRDHRVELVVQ